MWRQSDTLIKKSELGEIRPVSFAKNKGCLRSWTQYWLIGAETLQDSKTIEDWHGIKAFILRRKDVQYESRLNKPGATEQYCGTAGDRSDRGDSSLNYSQSHIAGKRSAGAVVHLSLILEQQPWCSEVGGIFPRQNRRGVIESSLSSPAELPGKSTKWGQTTETFQRFRTLCSNNLHNWLNCRLQLMLNTGQSLQNHSMSRESLEMSQNKTDFFNITL